MPNYLFYFLDLPVDKANMLIQPIKDSGKDRPTFPTKIEENRRTYPYRFLQLLAIRLQICWFAKKPNLNRGFTKTGFTVCSLVLQCSCCTSDAGARCGCAYPAKNRSFGAPRPKTYGPSLLGNRPQLALKFSFYPRRTNIKECAMIQLNSRLEIL